MLWCTLLFIGVNQQVYAENEFESFDSEVLMADLFNVTNAPFTDLEIEGATTIFGDIDNDGDLDVLISGALIVDSSIEYISRTYLNDGNGNFTEKENSNLDGAGRGDAKFGDIDNDGDLDLVITGATFGIDGKLAKTYLNDGDGNFSEKSNSLTGVQYGSVALGDIDNDGDLDLIISGQSNPYDFNDLTVYLNDGSGSFTSMPDDLPSIFRGSVILGDIDNDGDLDLFITGHNDFDGRISSTYINDGAGNFSEKSNPITKLERSSAAFGDIDNDGDLDLITSGNPPGSFQSREAKIYTNDGDGNFSEASQQPFTGVASGTVAFGDLNNDGSLDVINTGSSEDGIITERFMNDGNGNFTEDTGSLLNLAAHSIAMGDLDQDGALDLIIAGNYTNNDELVRLYTNISENSNTAPSAPGSLSAVQNGSEITLSWGSASDSETPSDGLSYNIFVKEDPESDPPYLISPMAQEGDGWRKLTAPGNQGQQKSYTLETPELACGESTTYTFRVQAVDHNFEGGSFSDEYNFTVQPPEILFVDLDATSGDNDGSSWENAYTDLHSALNNLGECTTEVWVAEGTYMPAGETTPLRLRENLSLLGGFDGTEDSPSGRNISDHPTILSGDVNESETANPGDAHTILLIPSVTNSVTIDGFIIESGYADGGGLGNRTGAAIDTNGNNTISNTIFRNNHAVGDGSNGVGGAVISFGGELTIINSLFYNNSSTAGGGAISAEGGTVQLINSTLTNNGSPKGGGIHFWAGNVVAINSIFYNNSGTKGNMNDDGGSGTGIAENSLFFNETSGNNGDLPPDINDSSGNLLNTNPVFADEENGDYSLFHTSAALNAGSNSPYETGEPAEGNTTDLAGNTRIFDGDTDIVDMGAYEFQGEPAEVEFTKTFDDPAIVGNTVTLEFTISNNPSASLESLTFTDDLDAVLSGLAATGLPKSDLCGSGSSLNGTSILTFTGGNLEGESSCTFEVTLQVPSGASTGDYINTTSSLFSAGVEIADPATDMLTVDQSVTASDQRIIVANNESYTFTPDDFGQDDNSFLVVIEDHFGDLNGEFELDGNPVSTDDKISVADIDDGDLIYTPPTDMYGYGYDSFEFSIEDAGGNPSDEFYTMSLDIAATSVRLDYNGEGWRFIGNPSEGDSYNDLLSTIWTKGMTGSDSPGATFANVYNLDQSDYKWETPSDLNNSTEPGQPFIVYIYSDDDNDGTDEGFPKTLTSGDNWLPLNGSFSFDELGYNDSPSNPENFYLLANPHPIALDFCTVFDEASTDIADNIDMWDPTANAGNGDYINLSCSVGEVPIAPFQAFWIRTTGDNPQISLPEESYSGETTEDYFKQNQQPEDRFMISLDVTGPDEEFSNQTRFVFSEDGTTDLDPSDGLKRTAEGLASRWLTFYSLDEDQRSYSLQNLPAQIEDKLRIPLDIQTTESGRYTLDWTLPQSHIFAGNYFLRDNQTGEVIELQEGSTYSFEIAEEQAQKASALHSESETLNLKHQTLNSPSEPRFELLITKAGVDGLTELGATPDNFTLAQNYPNPFNPTTVISYQLPVSSEVRLKVYDMLGRQVAELVNGQVAAGRHTINFDASNLSSGVYLYRLQAGRQIMTRKLTILK